MSIKMKRSKKWSKAKKTVRKARLYQIVAVTFKSKKKRKRNNKTKDQTHRSPSQKVKSCFRASKANSKNLLMMFSEIFSRNCRQ
jgi:hypothetical protein